MRDNYSIPVLIVLVLMITILRVTVVSFSAYKIFL